MTCVRVLFSTTAGTGHFGPMVPVALACANSGHDVAVAAPLSFASHVQRAGLPHLPFPDVPEAVMGAVFGRLPSLPREEANRIVIGEVFGRLDAQAALPTLLDLMETWRPDVVVRDPCEFGALAAAERSGIPQVQVAIGLGRFLDTAAQWLDDPIRELETRAGLREIRGVDRVLTTPSLSSVPAVLDDTQSEDATEHGRVWRFRTESGADGPSLPSEWGDPSAPLLYVTFGSVTGSLDHFGGIYPAILEALADLHVRVLLTTGSAYDPARLGTLPANAWVTQWWPQEAATREAAAMIGHGGFGTTMGALVAGVPQLVLPLFASDQFINAERVHAVGAGLQAPGGLDDIGAVPDLVETLIDEPRFADAARSIASDIAALPHVTTTVGVLERLVRERS